MASEILRTPVTVKGSVLGLPVGAPMREVCSRCGGTDIRNRCSYCGDSTFDHECNDGCRACGGGQVRVIDWSSPLALEAAIRWLMDRGHDAAWMRPLRYGGRVPAWDGMTEDEVAAILVSVSVREVAAGRKPVEGFVSMRIAALSFEAASERPAKTFYLLTFDSSPSPDNLNRDLVFEDAGEADAALRKMMVGVSESLGSCSLLIPGGVMVPRG